MLEEEIERLQKTHRARARLLARLAAGCCGSPEPSIAEGHRRRGDGAGTHSSGYAVSTSSCCRRAWSRLAPILLDRIATTDEVLAAHR